MLTKQTNVGSTKALRKLITFVKAVILIVVAMCGRKVSKGKNNDCDLVEVNVEY